MNKMKVSEARQAIAKVGNLMLQRNLTDLAGGNISIRTGDKIVISPSYAGTRKFWQLEANDVLVLDLAGNLLEGSGRISREAPAHIKLLKEFYPGGSAVIHAHARNVMVFCAAKQSIPPVLENTCKFDEIKVVKYARGGTHSQKLADNIYAGLRGQEKRIASSGAEVIAPWHGLFAVGRDIYSTLDAVERIEVNARCILMAALLPGGAANLEKRRKELCRHLGKAYGEGE